MCFALAAEYGFAVFGFDFFDRHEACSYQFAAVVAEKLHFGYSAVALKNSYGQKSLSFF